MTRRAASGSSSARQHLHRGLSHRLGEERHGHLDADRGGQIEDVARAGREPAEPLADHLADGGRDAERPRRIRREPLELRFTREQADDLADEERVAAGVAQHRLDGGGRRVDPGRCGHEAREGLVSEAAQHEPLGVRMPRDRGQRGVQRVVGDDVEVAIGRDDDDGGAPEMRRQELEQEERRPIDPVDILEGDEDRVPARPADQRPRRRVEQPEPPLVGRRVPVGRTTEIDDLAARA